MVNRNELDAEISPVAEITRRYRKSQGLTLAKFGEMVAERIPQFALSRQAVNRWESGRTPDIRLLRYAAMYYEDWRQQWALECLAVLLPGVMIGAK